MDFGAPPPEDLGAPPAEGGMDMFGAPPLEAPPVDGFGMEGLGAPADGGMLMDGGMGGGMGGGMDGGMDGGMLGGGMASEPPPDFSMPTIGPLAEKEAEARGAIEQFYAERTAKSEAKAKTNQEEAAMFVADRDATMLSE